jgi:hypothetical protein
MVEYSSGVVLLPRLSWMLVGVLPVQSDEHIDQLASHKRRGKE